LKRASAAVTNRDQVERLLERCRSKGEIAWIDLGSARQRLGAARRQAAIVQTLESTPRNEAAQSQWIKCQQPIKLAMLNRYQLEVAR
jgi:hypothetical protein